MTVGEEIVSSMKVKQGCASATRKIMKVFPTDLETCIFGSKYSFPLPAIIPELDVFDFPKREQFPLYIESFKTAK